MRYTAEIIAKATNSLKGKLVKQPNMLRSRFNSEKELNNSFNDLSLQICSQLDKTTKEDIDAVGLALIYGFVFREELSQVINDRFRKELTQVVNDRKKKV